MNACQDSCYRTTYLSPLGTLFLAATGDGQALTSLCFAGQKHQPDWLERCIKQKDLPVFLETEHWLTCYFAGEKPPPPPPLHLHTSPFRLRVLRQLSSVPYACITTYGAIAAQLQQTSGRAVSAQAVGGAVAHNPIALIIPCHRVLGSRGQLTGYAGGLTRKLALLEMEGVDTSTFLLPNTEK